MIELQDDGTLSDRDTLALTTMQRFLDFVEAARFKAGRAEMAKATGSMLNASQANRDLLAEVAAERAEIERLTAEQARSRNELEGQRFEINKAATKVAEDRAAADQRIEEVASRETAVRIREQELDSAEKRVSEDRAQLARTAKRLAAA